MYLHRLYKSLANYPLSCSYQLVRSKLLCHRQLESFDEAHPCVYVLSTGRVGTQTLSALFNLSKNVNAFHEPTPTLYQLSKLAYKFQNIKSAKDVINQAFIIARGESMKFSLRCGRGYIETSPQNTFLAPNIFELVPGVKFIHLIRDPKDVVRSGMRRNWYNGSLLDKNRIVPIEGTKINTVWKDWNPFKKNTWLWAETNCWITEFLKVVPTKQKLIVRSEEIFNNKTETVNDLFNFINSSPPSRRKVKAILGKKLNKQVAGSFPPSTLWTKEMYTDFFEMAGEVPAKFGYHLEKG